SMRSGLMFGHSARRRARSSARPPTRSARSARTATRSGSRRRGCTGRRRHGSSQREKRSTRFMALTASPKFENRWNPPARLSELDALVYRSNLLASDRAIVNFGGGNTSVKTREVDHAGRETTVLWVKGSGSDLATIVPGGFTGLRLDEILPLAERDAMSDE